MTNPVIDEDGSKFWYNSELELHREDGPAIEYTSGTKIWFFYGNYHREDGPAAEYCDGTKEWYINDKRHRDNGPAVVWSDGTKHWWIRGNNINEEVEQWIKDNNFLDYEQWDDSIKVLFKLKFG